VQQKPPGGAAANRGTAFSVQARDTLCLQGLQGLLPPLIETLMQQVARFRP